MSDLQPLHPLEPLGRVQAHFLPNWQVRLVTYQPSVGSVSDCGGAIGQRYVRTACEISFYYKISQYCCAKSRFIKVINITKLKFDKIDIAF